MSLPFQLTILFTISITFFTSHALNTDGTYLLSLKYAILNDPTSVLSTWDYLDQNPCSWNGVVCDNNLNVITLALPNSQLLGSLPPELGLIEHLQHLDLSYNSFNGSLPESLFNATNLHTISVSSNELTGGIPVFSASHLTLLNLSDNALGGQLPMNFTSVLENLTVLSLRGNYFSGNVPANFSTSVEIIDLSSNSFNGSLPSTLGVGPGLRYLNMSYNRISGVIPLDFAASVPENATIDLSYNNLKGEVPASKSLVGQNPDFLAGNEGLCGKPLKKLCEIPSTLSNPPNVTGSISPAIAVIPKPVGQDSDTVSNSSNGAQSVHNTGLKPAAIVGITMADLAGVGILVIVFLYLYQMRKKRNALQESKNKTNNIGGKKEPMMGANDHFLVQINAQQTIVADSKLHNKCLSKCLRGEESEGATTESRTSSDSEGSQYDASCADKKEKNVKSSVGGGENGGGELVMVDGETEIEVETLLKASAYILGASGTSIVYKAVLHNGYTFAVRRLGEVGFDKVKEFEGNVKAISKIKHPNLVRLRGFYWASDEKLVIFDYISNGSLASSAHKKSGSTPYHLPLEIRLRIARGVARGLSYIHEKRFVHANIKPSNILLTPEMEPIISDLGLSWLVYGNNSSKSGSARQFGSKRSTGSYDGTQDLSVSGSPYINPFGSTNGNGSPYQAPESLKNLKPNPKWDVYSFGIVLLELLTGKVYLDRELGQWIPSSGPEDKYWVLRIADVALRAEIQGKEEAMMSIFKLGFSCANLVPQKRPSMKDALQVLEKVSISLV